ncbi:protein Syd [Marinobacterium zhoushanense]|uniref:Protein Syd n=1 Tax=Marinobacterium zhoushanense TaxID=1679163 RepID=A0ABQ1KGJ5_9GAMM|nr:SecY-interacting protein [Marinobacterium zhoushanense]GGB95546.1 protein Syd [Marinobacterium zhoushanense]
MDSDLEKLLDRFIEQSMEVQQKHYGALPQLPFDPDWPSACVVESEPNADQSVHWHPVTQQPASDMFERLAKVLEIELHPDIRTWYTRYWSDPLPARHPDGELTLLFCWNEEDMERLRGNQLGHLMAKQKQRHPLSLFFACTDGDEFMTVDNRDGSVWLERPGRKPIKRLAGSLSEFLAALTPLPIAYSLKQ